jgi:endonuclease/exonuclease/phosphatase family metal-dependent hydrolase
LAARSARSRALIRFVSMVRARSSTRTNFLRRGNRAARVPSCVSERERAKHRAGLHIGRGVPSGSSPGHTPDVERRDAPTNDRRCALSVHALALLLCGCALRPAEHPRPAPTLRVATYNLNYGLAGDPATLEAIDRTDADVVLLQEVSPGWARRLRRRDGGFAHRCFATSRWPAGGAAILSRHPLRDCERSPSPLGWFPALAATVDGPLGPVRLVNLHLQPARAGPGVVADLAAMPARHRRELREHLARLTDPALPTVLAGDFNEGDGEGALRELSALGYRSALAEHAPSATTWRWPLGAMPLEKRLDHVLYHPGSLRCLSAGVLREGRSDHFPVVARLARPAPPTPPMGSGLVRGRTSSLTPRR